jgi:hypothetical protein
MKPIHAIPDLQATTLQLLADPYKPVLHSTSDQIRIHTNYSIPGQQKNASSAPKNVPRTASPLAHQQQNAHTPSTSAAAASGPGSRTSSQRGCGTQCTARSAQHFSSTKTCGSLRRPTYSDGKSPPSLHSPHWRFVAKPYHLSTRLTTSPTDTIYCTPTPPWNPPPSSAGA